MLAVLVMLVAVLAGSSPSLEPSKIRTGVARPGSSTMVVLVDREATEREWFMEPFRSAPERRVSFAMLPALHEDAEEVSEVEEEDSEDEHVDRSHTCASLWLPPWNGLPEQGNLAREYSRFGKSCD